MISGDLCDQAEAWNETVVEMNGHPLQLWGWGEVKSAHGWQAQRIIVREGEVVIGGAQVLTRQLPLLGKVIAYVPRGPFSVAGRETDVLTTITDVVKRHTRAIGLMIEPDREGEYALPKGWRPAKNSILLAKTLRLDLTKNTEDLLADISSKRRYDIRKSTKSLSSIQVVTDDDNISKCLEIYHETARRAGFALHDDNYYRDIARMMGPSSRLVAAFDGSEPVAFTWYAVTPAVTFELYGGISERGHRLRTNYALKWWGIEHFQAEGVRTYDFNGLLNDGISNFKRSFASHENQLIGTYEYSLSPLYSVWSTVLPLAKRLLRIKKRLLKR